MTEDHLGSPRVVTNQNGEVIKRTDWMAFGEEVEFNKRGTGVGYDEVPETRKGYTGYEKDDESGLDFAQARYYNPKHGRYTSVDPLTASANVKNPQTFNRYTYVLNSPYKFSDPLGLISQGTQTDLQRRSRKVRVPKGDGKVDEYQLGTFTPNSTPDGTEPKSEPAIFRLTQKQVAELSKMKKEAYQMQFVITKDNLNEAENGRTKPTQTTTTNGTSNATSESQGQSSSISGGGGGGFEGGKRSGNGSFGSTTTVERSGTITDGRENQSQDSGATNSGDASKAELDDRFTDFVHNFGVSNENSRLNGATTPESGDGKEVNALMSRDFFEEVAQREIAGAREAAIRDAIKAYPVKRNP